MSTIGKVFGGPPKKPGDDKTTPARQPSDQGDARTADGDSFTNHELESSISTRDDGATEPFSAGNPAPAYSPPKRQPPRRRQSDHIDGDIIPRERLRPSPAPYLKAVNEAYQPVIEQEKEDSVDLTRYLRVIRRHKWGILSITLIVLVFGVLAALVMTPIYRAQTTLVAEPFQRKMTVKDELINNPAVFLFYDTQFDIIRSRQIAERVVDRLGLVAKARQDLERAQVEALEPKSGIAAFVETVSNWFDWRQWIGDPDDTQALAPPTDAELRELVVAEVRDSVTVIGGKQSQIINIYFDHREPREAARLANAVANAYVNYGTDTRSVNSERTNQWLRDQIVEVRQNLKQSEEALLAYQEKTGLVDTGQQQSMSNNHLSQLTARLVEAKSRTAEAKLRYERALKLDIDGGNVGALETVLRSENAQEIALDLSNIERDIGELKSRVTDEHPLLKRARVERDEAKKALKKEYDKVIETLRNEYQVAKRKTSELIELIGKEKEEISETTSDTLELIRLEREVENNRRLYEVLLVRLQETDAARDHDASNIQILDKAAPPEFPFKPNKVRIVLLAGALGLGFGILLAFVREHLDRTLKTMDDIEEKLGLTALGLVPLVRNRDTQSVESEYHNNPRSPFAEKINHIRTGLLFSSIDQPPQTMLISSSTGDEGKTTLATNLAMAFSQLDRTLLLEVDLRKPSIGDKLKIEQSLGLTDLIINPELAPDVIKRYGDDGNLFVLTCGTRPGNPLELLSSQQFSHALDRLRAEFRYIILDGPPLLAVSDAAVLGHLVDMTLLVAKAEATSLKMIKDALSLMRKARVEPTGVVLTQTDVKRMAYYGGHYYHYDKRYYGEEQDTSGAAT